MFKEGRFDNSSDVLSEKPYSVSKKLSTTIDENGSSLIEHELPIVR